MLVIRCTEQLVEIYVVFCYWSHGAANLLRGLSDGDQ